MEHIKKVLHQNLEDEKESIEKSKIKLADYKKKLDNYKTVDPQLMEKITKLEEKAKSTPTQVTTFSALMKLLNSYRDRRLAPLANTCAAVLLEEVSIGIIVSILDTMSTEKDLTIKWNSIVDIHKTKDYKYKQLVMNHLSDVFKHDIGKITGKNHCKKLTSIIKEKFSGNNWTFTDDFTNGLGHLVNALLKLILEAMDRMHPSIRVTPDDVISHISFAFVFMKIELDKNITKKLEKIIEIDNSNKKKGKKLSSDSP
jgi:hypothetical protein